MYQVGDKVWYTENGPDDTGTIIEINHSPNGVTWYEIEWDDGCKDEYRFSQFKPL